MECVSLFNYNLLNDKLFIISYSLTVLNIIYVIYLIGTIVHFIKLHYNIYTSGIIKSISRM